MIYRVLDVKLLFYLREKEYLVPTSKARLLPSLAIIAADGPKGTSASDKRIGLYLAPTTTSYYSKFWEIIRRPLDTVQTYRALKLLGKCPNVEDDTLCACFYAMSREPNATSKRYLQSLKESGFSNVEECRKKILAQTINESFFINTFLQPILESDIPINGDEIHEEVALGNLSTDNTTIAHFATLYQKQAVV